MYIIVTTNKALAEEAKKRGANVYEDAQLATPTTKFEAAAYGEGEMKVINLMNSLAIKPNLKGYDYIKHIMTQCALDPKYHKKSMTKLIYPECAREFETTGEVPKFGNDDDRVDLIAKDMTHKVITELRKTPTYRNAEHTLSVLTITSNVMYGKNTAATPDGRAAGAPFAPGANPMHNREENGALASLNSVAKLSYDDCRDGISNTFSITPEALGREEEERINNLVMILDGYFAKKAHHINVNVMNRETLMKAYEDPEAYPNLTIRVSGYAVNFHKLSKEQQREVISRTFHEAV